MSNGNERIQRWRFLFETHALSWTTDLCFSISELRAAPVPSLTHRIKKTSTLCAVASMPRNFNKMAWAAVMLLWVLYCLSFPVTISFLRATLVTAVDSARRQEGERAIISNRGGEFSLSTFHRPRTGEWIWDKVFLTVWGMGIRDRISLGPPQTMHFMEVSCIRYVLMEVEDGWRQRDSIVSCSAL